jgi:outer membrane protein assembly factor BamB
MYCPQKTSIAILFALGQLFGSPVVADDWPQWRGPDRSGVSLERDLSTSWPAEGPPQVWLFRNCGLGYSGPAVVAERLYIMGARDNAEQLICLRVTDGSELWAVQVGDVLTNNWGDGPRGTPTVDGDRVYGLSGQGNLVCVSAMDGTLLWKARMEDFGGSVPGWGYTESVLIDGPRLICTPGGEQGAIVALDKLTGQRIWQSSDFAEPAQYASPTVADFNGIRQYIQLTEKNLVGINAENGAVVWRAEWPGSTAVIPTPIWRNDMVYATSGYGAGCNLFRINADNRAESLYDDDARKVMKNHHGGVVLVGEHVYGYSDSTGWVCQEWLTGKLMWRERSQLGKGSVICAGGMLYCLTEEDGIVALVEPSPAGWREVSRFTLEPKSEVRSPSGGIWTHPVVANGKLYLRDQDLLFSFDVQQKSH